MGSIIEKVISVIAKATLWRFSPTIIGVTGSVGKTSTKLAIAAVLSPDHRIRYAKGNLNSRLGLAMTIIGDWSREECRLVSHDTPAGQKKTQKLYFWIKVAVLGVWQILTLRSSQYPEVLILEYGADKPGDIRRLTKLACPNIGVVTAIGDVPAHVEKYENPEDVAREKSRLIDVLPPSGFAILNADDANVLGMARRSRAQVLTYGFSAEAALRVVGFETRIDVGGAGNSSFKLEYGGGMVPIKLPQAFGRAHAYAAAAAAAVGVGFNMNLIRISEAISLYQPAPGRMRVLRGIKNATILDDAYNASPVSVRNGLEVLAAMPAKRRVAVLGDMREIGKFTLSAHEGIGKIAAEVADEIVCVGESSKIIAEAARKAKMKPAHIHHFDDIDSALDFIGNMVLEGDVVLVKGSHSVGLEKAVVELTRLESTGPVV